jgi:hypothetical protein
LGHPYPLAAAAAAISRMAKKRCELLSIPCPLYVERFRRTSTQQRTENSEQVIYQAVQPLVQMSQMEGCFNEQLISGIAGLMATAAMLSESVDCSQVEQAL